MEKIVKKIAAKNFRKKKNCEILCKKLWKNHEKMAEIFLKGIIVKKKPKFFFGESLKKNCEKILWYELEFVH